MKRLFYFEVVIFTTFYEWVLFSEYLYYVFVEGFLFMGCLSLFIGSCYGNTVEVLSLKKRLMCKGTLNISYDLCLDFITNISILSPDEIFFA